MNPPVGQPLPLVAACGNSMAGDDAFGPLVAERLRALGGGDLQVVDLGMKPAGLLDHLDDCWALIIVDAALPDANFSVGRLVEVDFDAPRRPQLLHDQLLSSHGLSIAHELELARRLDMLPTHVVLVAATVSETAIGRPLSEAVGRLVGPAAERVLRLARRLRLERRETSDA